MLKECENRATRLFRNMTILDANGIEFDTYYDEYTMFAMDSLYLEDFTENELEETFENLNDDLTITARLLNEYKLN